jgi:N,N'-diacetyllegionaminate synthase
MDSMVKCVEIANRKIGPGQPCFIIAEVGVNHNGDMAIAHELIECAAKAGADSVKFQSYVTEDLVTAEAPKAEYQIETTGKDERQYKMLKELELTHKQQAELKTKCDALGIIYLCTPYEEKSADFLAELCVPAYKVASTDTTNTPFLRYLAKRNIPVILSTGMSTLGEVEEAVSVLQMNGLSEQIVLMHCTSEYPTPFREVNLRAMKTMERAFDCPVGFSDHTEGVGASPWAVALGAHIVEKHFTLDRNLDGPDHRASLEVDELKDLIVEIRNVEEALGDGIKRPTDSEIRNKPRMRKSLVAKRNIAPGEIIRFKDLTSKRPGFGLKPSWIDEIVGKAADRPVKADALITLNDIRWNG